MIYPIKTLSQLPLVLKGFRKSKGLTQAAMAEKLGITQQSYAYFEANPSTATLERLFMVLRLLDIEISLDQPAATRDAIAATNTTTITKARPTKSSGANARKKTNSPVITGASPKAKRIAAPSCKKETW
ncbi:helix-turn-helix transcriptional regulator [Denitratisoma sp. agr-D3]